MRKREGEKGRRKNEALISIARRFFMCLPSQSDCVSSRDHKADLWLGTSGVSWAGHVCKCCLNAPPGGTAPGGLLRLWFLLAAGDVSFILLPVQSYVSFAACVIMEQRGCRQRGLLKMKIVPFWLQNLSSYYYNSVWGIRLVDVFARVL